VTDVEPGLEPGVPPESNALAEPEASAEPEAEQAEAAEPIPPDTEAEQAEAAEPIPPDTEAAAGPVAAPDSEVETPLEPTAAPAGAFRPLGANFRVMEVDDVTLELPSQYPAVTLAESGPPNRLLVFPVGLTEGTAMALALRRMEGRRPMTHELFMHVLQRARIDVIAVRLTGREGGNLLAELDLMTPSGRERVDCRPSDGLILALRMPVASPVLVDERLLEEAGDVAPFDDGGA
jgi:bifunctional DNase/RNase